MPASALAKADLRALSVGMKDTLEANDASQTLSNNLVFRNSAEDTLRFELQVRSGEGWRAFNERVQQISVPPGEKKILPLNLVRRPGGIAGIHTLVELRITDPQLRDTILRSFAVKNKLIARFSLKPVGDGNISLINAEKEKQVSFTLKNSGNMPMRYRINWDMSRFMIRHASQIILPPNTDTVVSYKLVLKPQILPQVRKEVLQVTVEDDSSKKQYLNYFVSHGSGSASLHPNAYKTFPISVEAGVMYRANSRFIYGSVTGGFDFGKGRTLQGFYRSEEYNDLNINQTHVFNLNYRSRRFDAYIGQAQHFSDFMVYGNELSLGTRFGKSGRLSAWVIKPYENRSMINSNQNREQAGANLGFSIGKVQFDHTFTAVADTYRTMNAALFSTRVQLINSKSVRLGIRAGLGCDSLAGRTDLLGYAQGKAGHSLGAAFYAAHKAFALNVDVLQNSNDYPGLNRGQKRYDVSLSWAASKALVFSPFYSSNRVLNNYAIDTLLNTNRLSYNMERYGLRTQLTAGKGSYTVSLGRYRDINRFDMPQYNFADFNVNIRSGANFGVNLSSQSGISTDDRNNMGDVWFNSTNLTAIYRNFYVSGNYYRYPFRSIDVAGTGNAMTSTQTMSLVGGYNLRVGSRLTGNIGYELMRFSMNTFVTHNGNASLTYNSLNNSFRVRLQGSMPLQAASSDNATYLFNRNYLQITVGKTFNLPAFSKKKYFDLKVRLFQDLNNNDQRDDGEPLLSGAHVNINDRLFVTGRDGFVRYNNVDRGKYSVDISKANQIPGIIPVGGFQRQVELNEDVNLLIPFKPGKIVFGDVGYLMDSLSSAAPPPLEGIKIIILDSTGVVGHAMTDPGGRFRITVPAGKYTVSLNEKAFNDKMKPVQVSFQVDLIAKDSTKVQFKIRQAKRAVRIIEVSKESVNTPIKSKVKIYNSLAPDPNNYDSARKLAAPIMPDAVKSSTSPSRLVRATFADPKTGKPMTQRPPALTPKSAAPATVQTAERDVKAAFDTAPVTIEPLPAAGGEPQTSATQAETTPALRSSKGSYKSGYRQQRSRTPQRKPNPQGCKPFFAAPAGNTPR